MSSERNTALVNDFVDVVWRGGRLDRLGDFWTVDCVNHADSADANEGLAALKADHEGFAAFFAAFSNTRIGIVQQVADNERVVTHMRTVLDHTGTFKGIAATGLTVVLESMRIDRVVDGRIAEHWSVADLAGLMRQIGS